MVMSMVMCVPRVSYVGWLIILMVVSSVLWFMVLVGVWPVWGLCGVLLTFGLIVFRTCISGMWVAFGGLFGLFRWISGAVAVVVSLLSEILLSLIVGFISSRLFGVIRRGGGGISCLNELCRVLNVLGVSSWVGFCDGWRLEFSSESSCDGVW